MKNYKKEAKELLKDLKRWIGLIDDESLINYIEKDLNMAYIDGKLEIIKGDIAWNKTKSINWNNIKGINRTHENQT